MADSMLRALWREPAIRFAMGDFTELAAEGIIRHDADPVAARVLAGGLMAGALTGVMLDEPGERASIRIDYDGPVRGILVDVASDGTVRGLVRNPHVMTEADSLEQACGDGSRIGVVRSLDGRTIHAGECRSAFVMPSAAIGYFLSASDQIETEIRCEVRLAPDPQSPVRQAAGFFMQAMPGCDLELFDALRKKLYDEAVTRLLFDEESPEKRFTAILQFLAPPDADAAAPVFPVAPPRFQCRCREQEMRAAAARTLGVEGLKKLLAENPSPELRCRFCNQVYHLSDEDLKILTDQQPS